MTSFPNGPSPEPSASSPGGDDPNAVSSDAARAGRAALFDALSAAQIVKVTVEFDGYDDSSQMTEILARGADNEPVSLPEVSITVPRHFAADPKRSTVPLHEAIEQLVYDLLGETRGGWENYEGAFGTFTFDVAARGIRLEYHERFVDTLYSEHEF